MKLMSLLYLFCFFAPIAFLIGYMVGAPRPVAPAMDFGKIDTRAMPVSPIELNRLDGAILAKDDNWLIPNASYKRQ